MPRYFVRPRAAWVETDFTRWSGDRLDVPQVCDHEPVETGLLDSNGDMIMRSPRPIGFMRDEEW